MKISTIQNTYKPISFKNDSTSTPTIEPVPTVPAGTVALPTPIASDMPQFSKSSTKLKEPSFIAKFFTKLINSLKDFAKKPGLTPLEYRPGMTTEALAEQSIAKY